MLTRSLVVAVSLVLAVGVVPACGSATDQGLFGAGSADAGASSGSTEGGGGGSRDDARSDGPASDAGLLPDGAHAEASGPVDPGISCGGAECHVATEECCRTEETTKSTFRCVARGACVLNNQLAIPCDDAADCAALGSPGDVCCASSLQGAVYQVACTPPSQCSFAAGHYVFCDPTAPDPCPVGGSCGPSASTTVPYDYCRH